MSANSMHGRRTWAIDGPRVPGAQNRALVTDEVNVNRDDVRPDFVLHLTVDQLVTWLVAAGYKELETDVARPRRLGRAGRTEHHRPAEADACQSPDGMRSLMGVQAASTVRRRRRTAASTAPVGTIAAYIRVSTDEQATSGAGLDAQRTAITTEADRRGWTIADWYADEGLGGGKPVEARPQLAAALQAVESGAVAALMVAKSDRLSRGLRALLDVLGRAEHAGGVVVAVDGSIDTSTAAGRFTTQIMGGVAELERALISDRTKAALAEKRKKGVRLGRPSTLPADVIEFILTARAAGLSYPAIAAQLNTEGVSTAHGGAKWWPANVRNVERGQDAIQLLTKRSTAAIA